MLAAVANGIPVIMSNILAERFAQPLDGGLRFVDGRPLLGYSKTLRGIVASVIVTTLLAPVLGLSWMIGATIGVFAMLGDITSSFIKRRLNMPPHSMAPVLDQVPECLFPLLAVMAQLGLSWWDILIVVTAFVLLHLLLSPLLFKLRIRKKPY